jgi:mannitol 2-dehydrogenase
VIELNASSLGRLQQAIRVPDYDRSQVQPGIVHIGVGSFHRSHQAVYIQRVLESGESTWGISGVGILPDDRRMQQVLARQDCLYSLVVKRPDGRREVEVVGSIIEYLFGPDAPWRVLQRLAAKTTRIVSLTITEGGYKVDPLTGGLDSADPDITRDARPGAVPRSVFGLLVTALDQRRKRRLRPFTIMSCDNIPSNGDLTRVVTTDFAKLVDPLLAEWIESRVAFPNSMVDRITPATADGERRQLAKDYRQHDAWPVVCEPYMQWVLEDSFSDGRPAFETVGVEFVEDVGPYELMKIRLLNGGHQAIGFLGFLLGHEDVHEAVSDPLLALFLNQYLDVSVTPTLQIPESVDLTAYKASIVERFSNPQIADPLTRICADSSDRIPKFVLPVVRDLLRQGGDIRPCMLLLAAWARYAEGIDEHGRPVPIVDPMRERLTAAAQRRDPTAFISVREVFGDLADSEHFRSAFAAAIDLVRGEGVREAVRRTCSQLTM